MDLVIAQPHSDWATHLSSPKAIIMDMKEPEKWRRLVDVSYVGAPLINNRMPDY